MAFSADQVRLYVGAWPCVVTVWDLSSGQPIATLGEQDVADLSNGEPSEAPFEGPLLGAPIGRSTIHCIVIGPGGGWLVAADYNHPVRILDATSGAVLHRLRGHSRPLASMALSADGRRLVTSSFDGTLRLWDTDTWQEVAKFTVTASRVAWDDSGEWMYAAGLQDDTLRVLETASGAVRDATTVDGRVTSLAVCGGTIWVGCSNGAIFRYGYEP